MDSFFFFLFSLQQVGDEEFESKLSSMSHKALDLIVKFYLMFQWEKCNTKKVISKIKLHWVQNLFS